MELEEIKLFLRIDSDDEDVLLLSLQAAAEAYLLNAGVLQTYPDKLYTLAVKMLLCHFYENRSPVITGTISKTLEYSLSQIVTQLKFMSEVVE